MLYLQVLDKSKIVVEHFNADVAMALPELVHTSQQTPHVMPNVLLEILELLLALAAPQADSFVEHVVALLLMLE